MKSYLRVIFTLIIFFLAVSGVFSTPLNGTYTVGSGGAYATINAAANDLDSQGVSGPVIFRILNGTYNEFTILKSFSGASATNTATFESFSGNPDDVIISFSPRVFQINGAAEIIIRNLTLGNIELRSLCVEISITGNKFTNAGITQFEDLTLGLNILNNTGLSGIIITSMALIHQNINISNNIFNSPNGFISITSSNHTIIQGNTVSSLSLNFCDNLRVSKNKLEFFGASVSGSSGGVEMRFCKTGLVSNNFTTSNTHVNNINFQNDSAFKVVNNSFTSVGIGVLTTVSVSDNTEFTFWNNIVTNTSGNYVVTYNNNIGLSSNFNDYYNGSAIRLISHNGTNYDDIGSFIAATGLDATSTVRAVDFVSDSNLHLEGSSISDYQLIAATDPLVPDDIDGQPRSALYPYKGADEADIPLPVELASFTSVVQNNTVLLNWTTSMEENNSGFDIERSVFNNASQQWIKVGFVNGSGTQSSGHSYSFRDNGLNSGKYNYRLKQTDFNGNYHYYNLSNEVIIGIPQKYELSQNYPNPFNPSTKINYNLQFDGKTLLKIFDISGREISSPVNEFQTAGYYSVSFDARGLSSGVYFYTLTSGNFNSTKRMLLVK